MNDLKKTNPRRGAKAAPPHSQPRRRKKRRSQARRAMNIAAASACLALALSGGTLLAEIGRASCRERV